MKKVLFIFIILSFIMTLATGCNRLSGKKQNLIQSKRRFAEYVEPQAQKPSNVVDLSEGPKLKYDAHLGPKNLNFDIKIVDPY